MQSEGQESALEQSDAIYSSFPSSSDATEPVHSIDEYLETTACSASTPKSKTFAKFLVPPSERLTVGLLYPGNIPSPFPLEEPFITYLRMPRNKFASAEMYPAYLKTIEKFCDVILAYLKRKPTRSERNLISKKLCTEYSVLQCGNDNHATLAGAIRKKLNNSATKRRKAMASCLFSIGKDRGKSGKKPRLQNLETPQEKKRKLDAVRLLRGDSRLVLLEFPCYKSADMCFEDFAYIQNQTVEVMKTHSSANWEIFTSTVLDSDADSGVKMTVAVLDKIWGSNARSLLLKVSQNGQFRGASGQPYLFCGNPDCDVLKVTVMIDLAPFVAYECDNDIKGVSASLLLLFAVYYIMDLKFPIGAGNMYDAVSWLLIGEESDLPPKGKFLSYRDFARKFD